MKKEKNKYKKKLIILGSILLFLMLVGLFTLIQNNSKTISESSIQGIILFLCASFIVAIVIFIFPLFKKQEGGINGY